MNRADRLTRNAELRVDFDDRRADLNQVDPGTDHPIALRPSGLRLLRAGPRSLHGGQPNAEVEEDTGVSDPTG